MIAVDAESTRSERLRNMVILVRKDVGSGAGAGAFLS